MNDSICIQALLRHSRWISQARRFLVPGRSNINTINSTSTPINLISTDVPSRIDRNHLGHNISIAVQDGGQTQRHSLKLQKPSIKSRLPATDSRTQIFPEQADPVPNWAPDAEPPRLVSSPCPRPHRTRVRLGKPHAKKAMLSKCFTSLFIVEHPTAV